MPLLALSLDHFPGSQPLKSKLRVCAVFLGLCSLAVAQHQLPYLDAARNSPIAQVDFAEIYRQQMILDAKDQAEHQQGQFEPGTVSALDILAPRQAVEKLKQAESLLRAQRAKDAIHYLQKAIEIYPKFVSAHIVMGLAYFDLRDKRAKEEFETATQLDDQFPISYLYLGMISLWSDDFGGAAASLEKAAFLDPNDAQILNALAFAQNGSHKYADVLRTVRHIHKLDHHGMADVHYVAAAAALSLRDFDSTKTELNIFLKEDPSGPLSAVARRSLVELTRPEDQAPPTRSTTIIAESAAPTFVTFPNTPHLQAQLNTVAGINPPEDLDMPPQPPPAVSDAPFNRAAENTATWANPFTLRQTVDETALFLSVSDHGAMVNNLSLSDIQIRDDNKPPDRILQFLPQSELPLRLGVLIDTSGSVEHRISFEKKAAKTFLEKVLNPQSDLAFVASFGSQTSVDQDFTGDLAALNQGIDHIGLTGDGTAVFDAIHFACWKLAAYPDESRVARVLVLLTDGEDNASHRSLQQSIDAAESAGITVYTINTAATVDAQSDANHVLQAIAGRTGGQSAYPQGIRELERYFQQISDAIRNRYLIAYKPANFVPDGSYRSLKVFAAHNGKHLQVHVRKGYYARLASNP